MLAILGAVAWGIWWWLKPKPVDAYLEPYYEGNTPEIWPKGTQFGLKTKTTIGRSTDADVAVPSMYKTVHRKALTLHARGTGDQLRFFVKPATDDVKAWIDRLPIGRENSVLEDGQVLSLEGVLNLRLMLREPTQPWISTGGETTGP